MSSTKYGIFPKPRHKIAEGHEFIKNKYGKQTAEGIIKMYKSKLSSADKAAKQAVQEISETATEITPDKLKTITDSIKSAIKLEQTSISENKFSNIAKKAAEILKNKKVEFSKEEAEIINTSIVKALENNAEQSVIQVETKLKPFVDIVTQPFKFVLSGIKLPFNIFKGLVNMAVSPIEKKAAQEVLGLAQLTDFEKAIHKAVREIFGEQKAKSGKISQTIFVNAIEQLDKHTQPFRKAEAAYQQALKTGSETAIKEAREVYEAAMELDKELSLHVV